MRNRIILNLVLFIVINQIFNFTALAQDQSFAFTNSLSSPESKGSTNGSSNVDMLRGVLNTSIPLYNFKGKEIDLPLSMSYSSSGIKVNQIASNIGLGWNLNFGGRITREVQMIPDDRTVENYANIQCHSAVGGNNDIDPHAIRDYYRMNVMGMDELFKRKYGTATFECITNTLITIEVNIQGHNNLGNGSECIFTVADGTKFYFGQNNAREKTTSNAQNSVPNCPDIFTETISVWLLTKIISKNKLDQYDFVYQNYEWANYIPVTGDGKYDAGVVKIVTSEYKVNQQIIKEIYHNSSKIVGFNHANRDDLNFVGGTGNKLTEILFYNYKGAEPNSKVQFSYSYFGPVIGDYLSKRLKLNEIEFLGIVSNTISSENKKYKFDYISPELVPRIDSMGKDYIGLYNGRDDNANLLNNPYNYYPGLYTNCNLPNSKRSYDFTKSLIGTLSKIIFPNKGYQEFEYDQNALNGGYGLIYHPDVTPMIPTNQVLGGTQIGPNISCSYENSVATTPNNTMLSLNLMSFPNSCYATSNYHYNSDVKSTFMRIDNGLGTTLKLQTGGNGVYLIQRLPNVTCNTSDDSTGECINDSGVTVPSVYNTCMINTNEIFYTGSNSSQPLDFIKGGLTGCGESITDLSLQDGNYQITIWSYDNESASVSVYKEILVPGAVIPAFYENLDVNTNLVDGFRIKSITSFDQNNKFISKKKYRYNNGILNNVINNFYPIYTYGGYTVHFNSHGYSNPANLIYNKEIYEINVNELQEDKGYTLYKHDNLDNMIDTNLYLLRNDVSLLGVSALSMNRFKLDMLTSKSIFNKSLILTYKEDYLYDQNQSPLRDGDFNMHEELPKFYFLSKKITTNYYEANKKILHEQLFEYDYQKILKSTSNTTDIIEYEYNPLLYYDGIETPVSDIKSNIGGHTKYIYSDVPGQFLGNPVTRYFITEIQASKPNEPLEPKTRIEYDADGNMVSTVQVTPGAIANNQWDSFVYGYDNRFVVAKLTGIKYSDIPPALIASIKTATSQAITPTSIAAVETALNALRTSTDANVAAAQITTYTYNPVYGALSMTDAKGYSLYTEYDAFGRLARTKEKAADGSFIILSENEYNTRTE